VGNHQRSVPLTFDTEYVKI